MRNLLSLFALLLTLSAYGYTTNRATVNFTLADFIDTPSSNRFVLITPLSADILDDARTHKSDATGQFTVTNMVPGLYQIDVQSPPKLSTRYIAVPDSNGVTFTAFELLTTKTNLAWPPPGYAWTVAASDARYSPIGFGTNGVSSFNTRTGAVVLASNDVVTALGYAPGTGNGSGQTEWPYTAITNAPWITTGITNGQAGVSLADLSFTNDGDETALTLSDGLVTTWTWSANSLVSIQDGGTMLDVSASGDITSAGDIAAASFSGRGPNLTNLNASALASGTVPLDRLSGIGSNQLDTATWLLATNTTPGWKLTEPGYVGGTNTFEPVYTKTQGTNLFIRGNTNSAADGLYTVQTNWVDGEATAYLYTNANADVIFSTEVDLDRVYTFTNAAGQTNFTAGVIYPTYGQQITNTLSGGLCGEALFSWTTNYAFVGFGVNGSAVSDGAVLAWGTGLDYTTNGGVWTVYATNIPALSLGTTNAPEASKVLAVDASNRLYWGSAGTGSGEVTLAQLEGATNLNTLSAMGVLTNGDGAVIYKSARFAAWSTNYLKFGAAGSNSWMGPGTNVLGIWLTNGYAQATFENINGAYAVMCSVDYTNWSSEPTNVPVAIALVQMAASPGLGDGDPYGVTNFALWSWVNPVVFNTTNELYGQHLRVDQPAHDNDAAPRKWVKDNAVRTALETNRLWSAEPAVRRVDLEGWPLDLDSQFELVVDKSQSNYFAVNLLDVGSVFAQWRSTNAPARIADIRVGVWTELSADPEVWGWTGTAPVTIYIDTNGLTAMPTVEYATNLNASQWRLVPNVTNSYPDTSNDWYVVRFEPPAASAVFRASVKGGKALEVFGDVRAETFTGDGSGLTNVKIPVVPEASVNTNWVEYPPSAAVTVSSGAHLALSSMAAGGGGWFAGADQFNAIRLAGTAYGGGSWSVPMSQMMAGTNVLVEAQFCTSNNFPFSVWLKVAGVNVSSSSYFQTTPVNHTTTTADGTNFWWFRTNFTIPNTNCIGMLTVGNFSTNANTAYLTMVRMKITP